ncbi:MAG: hypothetical protein WEA56_14455 [Balneolaceae bacterium]
MDNDQTNDELFRRFLDGELSKEDEKRALHTAAENDEMRNLLRFERTLFRTFSGEPDPDSFTVPENFSGDVMEVLSAQENRREEEISPLTEQIASWWREILKPRPVVLHPAYVVTALVLLSFGVGYILQNQQQVDLAFTEVESSAQQVSETEGEIWIRFVYFDDNAEKIEIAGDFSDWEPVELEQEWIEDKQVWTGLIPLSRGEHRYMFVKDGEEWVADPLASVQRNDGFGNKNSVLYL